MRDLPGRVRRFIEDRLITEGGFRNSYSREDAIAEGLLSDQQLESLVKGRLLRVERHLGADRIELVHDLLTSVVQTFRDEERARSQRKALRRRMLAAATAGLAALIVAALWFIWQMEALDVADKQRTYALTVASRKDYDQAAKLLADQLAVYLRARDASRTARVLVDRERFYALAGKLDLANKDLQRALDTATRAQRAGDEALALEAPASLTSDEDSATSLYRIAIEKYQIVGDAASPARLWEWIATQEERRRRFGAAVDDYHKALESYRVASDRIGIIRVSEATAVTSPGATFSI